MRGGRDEEDKGSSRIPISLTQLEKGWVCKVLSTSKGAYFRLEYAEFAMIFRRDVELRVTPRVLCQM